MEITSQFNFGSAFFSNSGARRWRTPIKDLLRTENYGYGICFTGAFHRLGPRVGEEGGAEVKLGGNLHELVVKVRRGGDLAFFRIFPQAAIKSHPA